MRRIIAVAVVALVCASNAPAHAQRSAERATAAPRRFIGTWRLVLYQADSAGHILNRGAHPTGLLYYDATGHMAAQIQPDRRRPSWPQTALPTAQQALEAVTGYAAYFGTYIVDEKARTVTHHQQGALDLDVVDYVLGYEFDGNDRLILLPVGRPRLRLVWAYSRARIMAKLIGRVRKNRTLVAAKA